VGGGNVRGNMSEEGMFRGGMYIFALLWFLSRVSTLTRDIDIAILSVREVPVSDENGLTLYHSFFHRFYTVAQSF